jgi:hypothetical protein
LDHSTDRESIPLVAGGGEFFEAILKAFDKQHSLRPDDPMTITQGSLLIRGSMVSATSDWPEVAFGLHGQSNEVADRVQSMLQRHARVALRGDSSFHEQPGEHLTRLIEVAKRAIVECQPTVVWIEGGRTASRLVRACGWNRLTPIAVHGDGVVRLRVQGTTAPELVLKPGSYAWPKDSHLPPRVSGG